MFLPFLIAIGLQQDPVVNTSISLFDVATKQQTSQIVQMAEKMKVQKVSPKKIGSGADPTTFDWVTVGYGSRTAGSPGANPCFEVYSQERSEKNDRALGVTRMLQRLWEYNFHTLKLDHSFTYGHGIVQVFMCFGGKAGGEQAFEEDDQVGPLAKVDDIYFYDLDSFTGPVEMAREVAHEYGHATLPAIGGYKEPEDWANGYLGEKLFLRHIEQAMERGLLTPDDAMGASMPQLKTWVTANVNPLVARAAVNGPNPAGLKSRTKAGMEEYLGLALYVDTILPEAAFSRSMQMVGSTDAQDYPDAVVLAAEEPPGKYTVNIPDYLAGKAIWFPLGKCKLFGATVVRRNGEWALIRPIKKVTIVPPHA